MLLQNYYRKNQKLTTDPASQYTSEIKDQPRAARLYLLPKIHKPGNPGRPIVASNGAPTENISRFVDFFLQPGMVHLPFYIRDPTDFLNKLRRLAILPCTWPSLGDSRCLLAMPGLQDVSLGLTMAFNTMPGEFLQIVHTSQDYWVAISTTGMKHLKVKIYDSLFDSLLSLAKAQIASLLCSKEDIIEAHIMDVKLQGY